MSSTRGGSKDLRHNAPKQSLATVGVLNTEDSCPRGRLTSFISRSRLSYGRLLSVHVRPGKGGWRSELGTEDRLVTMSRIFASYSKLPDTDLSGVGRGNA